MTSNSPIHFCSKKRVATIVMIDTIPSHNAAATFKMAAAGLCTGEADELFLAAGGDRWV